MLTPERVVAAETRRTLTALALHGLRVDGLVANRGAAGAAGTQRGAAARWLRERHAEQQAVLAELAGLAAAGAHRRATAAEPTGVPALLQVAGVAVGHTTTRPGNRRPRRRCCACAGRRGRRVGGREFELVLHPPGGRGAAGPGPGRRRAGRHRGGCGGWWRCPRCCAAAPSPAPGWTATTCGCRSGRTRRCGCGPPEGRPTRRRRVPSDDGGRGAQPRGTELRALALVALDRLDPLLARVRDGAVDGRGTTRPAPSCPICAVLALLRGERPELAVGRGRAARRAARRAAHGAGGG